jgi:excinuclease ABC subunit B
VDETQRRRAIQEQYNAENGITPTTIENRISSLRDSIYEADYVTVPLVAEGGASAGDVTRQVTKLRAEMRAAAEALDFERAADLRDRIRALEEGAVLAGFEAEPRAASGQPARGPRGSAGRGRRPRR